MNCKTLSLYIMPCICQLYILFMYIYIYSRNTRLRRDFPSPPGEWRLRRHLSAGFGHQKKLGCLGHPFQGAPHSFKNVRRVMRIHVLSFEIGQRERSFYSERTDRITDRITQPSCSVLVYRYVCVCVQVFKGYQLQVFNQVRALQCREVCSLDG